MDQLKEVTRIFRLQKAQYDASKVVSYETRVERLNQLEKLVRTHYKEIVAALQEDFGSRDEDIAFLADIYPTLDHINFVRKNLKKWMKREKQSDGFLGLLGQRTYIQHEPLGVVGVMSPFNAPVSLAFDPAVDAIAAGNTAMVRLPESNPKTAELIKKLAQQHLDEKSLAVITGDIEVAKHFAALPWDKFVFTGGTEIGKHILAAAAPNLTPVLLELGGKSPVVILDDADLELVAQKTAKTRLMNGGQVCIGSDYILLPNNKLDAFVGMLQKEVETIFPTVLDNEKYTSIVGDAAYNRLVGYIDEAQKANVKVISVNPSKEKLPCPTKRKIPFTMIVNPPQEMKICQDEVFGPVLPIIGYNNLSEALEIINEKEKPLAMYIFGKNTTNIDRIVNETSAGGITINDYLLHAGTRTMGFGGVGHSGMGRYKGGKKGFEAFSNPKSVFVQGLIGKYTTGFMPPLTNEKSRKMLYSRVGIKL